MRTLIFALVILGAVESLAQPFRRSIWTTNDPGTVIGGPLLSNLTEYGSATLYGINGRQYGNSNVITFDTLARAGVLRFEQNDESGEWIEWSHSTVPYWLLGNSGASEPFLIKNATNTVLSIGQDSNASFLESVGVGTNTPARTLHVAGTVRIDRSDGNWTTDGWQKRVEMDTTGVIMWRKGAATKSRAIGYTSTNMYFMQSTADDATGAGATVDIILDGRGWLGIDASVLWAPLTLGSGSSLYSDDSSVVITRKVDGVGWNVHGFADNSWIDRRSASLAGIAWNSFDGRCLITGTNDYNHYAFCQLGPTYGSSGVMTNIYGLVNITTITNGTVQKLSFLDDLGTTVTSPGQVLKYMPLYLPYGSNYVHNLGIGTNAPSTALHTHGTITAMAVTGGSYVTAPSTTGTNWGFMFPSNNTLYWVWHDGAVTNTSKVAGP